MVNAHQSTSLEFENAQYDRARLLSLFDIALCTAVSLGLMMSIWLAAETPIKAPHIVVGAIGLYGVIHRWRLPRVLAATAVLLVLPLFSLLSAFWSIEVAATLRYGTLYLLTVVLAVLIGAGMKSQDVMIGLFLGLLIYALLAITAGPLGTVVTMPDAPFVGYQGSKNQAAEAAGITVLISTATMAFAMNQRKVWLVFASILNLALAVYILIESEGIGALIACGVAWLCLLAWLISRGLSRQTRVSIFVLALLTVTIMLVSLDYWIGPLFDFVLEASGKDRGLTGRDFIWRVADDMIERKPILGIGYSAFWLESNFDASMIMREFKVKDPRGFNFHSTHREITVHLGYVGLAIFVTVFAVSALTLLVRTMVEASYPLIFASSLLVYFSMKFPLESFGFGGMHLAGLLMFIILAMGYSSLISRNKQQHGDFV